MNELVPQNLTQSFIALAQEVAPLLCKKPIFGITDPDQAIAIMIKGHELGLGLTASFDFIKVIQGQVAVSPRGALALIWASGLLINLDIQEERDDKDIPCACTVTMVRKGNIKYTCRFTIDDAARAGLIVPGSAWIKWRANMLRWRPVGFCADIVFADKLAGLKTADQYGAAIDEAGDVIEVAS